MSPKSRQRDDRGAAPIDSLPAEILLAVFSLAARAHDDDRPCYDDPSIYQHFRRRANPAIAISHVSTRWRSLAHSTPNLWTTLYLDGDVDGDRAEAKARWWSRRAATLPPPMSRSREACTTAESAHGEEEGTKVPPAATSKGSEVVSLVMTRIQDWTPDDFVALCDSLELLHLESLESVRFSWMGGGLSTDENRQLQTAFRFLLPSAHTLQNLTVHSASHLRIGFSLPRLGHTFSALEQVEVRSCKLALPASDAYLLPTFLPRYAGESDWRPLTSLKRLVLVGPVWRLRYQDGTIASPVVSSADLPALEFAQLGSTAPPVFWNLLSHQNGTLRHLILEDHFDHPNLPDPDLLLGIANLCTLKLLRSAPLATRLLNCALLRTAGPALRFMHLETLEIPGAQQLEQGHLDLFATTRAPSLRRLVLSDTTTLARSNPPSKHQQQLQFPSMARLEDLVLVQVEWTTAAAIVEAVETSRLPRLRRLTTDLQIGNLDKWKLQYRNIEIRTDCDESV